MKVSTILEYLTQYNPDEELIIGWWDKETAEIYNDTKLSDKEWEDVVQAIDYIDHAFESVTNAIYDGIREVKGKNK